MFLQHTNQPILIIGAGNLGEALINGMLNKGLNISALVKTEEKMLKLSKYYPSLKVAVSKKEIDIDGKIVILAVKPSSFFDMRFVGKAKAFISVMARVCIDEIKLRVESEYYIRAMPNLAARCAKSITAVTGSQDFKNEALSLFSVIGESVWVENEDELNIATALAGSGPAFLALVAEAMIDGAVKVGLKRSTAEEMTRGVFDGFSSLLKESKPSQIKEEVMSPKGTTAAGIYELESKAIRAAFMKAIEAAYHKASK